MEIYAPIKAQITDPMTGKTATVMLGSSKVATIEESNIIGIVKLTAGIVDGFAKGYHVDAVTLENDKLTITAKKE